MMDSSGVKLRSSISRIAFTKRANSSPRSLIANSRKYNFRIALIGAVRIELKATLKRRKLLILLNGKNAKNTGFAQVRYTAGTPAVWGCRLIMVDVSRNFL